MNLSKKVNKHTLIGNCHTLIGFHLKPKLYPKLDMDSKFPPSMQSQQNAFKMLHMEETHIYWVNKP